MIPPLPQTAKSLLNVLGIGNALVDVQARVPDDLLAKVGYEKGVMTLVDDSVQIRVLSELGEIDTFRCAGGSAANTILGVAQLGGTAAYAGKTAADDLGEFFVKDLREAGVRIEVEPAAEGHTGTCVVLITDDAERTMLTHLGVSATLSDADIDAGECAKAEWVYVEGYLFGTPENQSAARAAIKAAKKGGAKVALTVSDPFLVNAFKADFLELIGGPVDLLFCNLDEARGLTGKESARGLRGRSRRLRPARRPHDGGGGLAAGRPARFGARPRRAGESDRHHRRRRHVRRRHPLRPHQRPGVRAGRPRGIPRRGEDKAIDEWLEGNIGKKSDVQADLEAYTRDMASARKTKQECLIAQEKELADIRALHSVQLKELADKENLIIETHPTVEKIRRGVDDIILALLKTKKEVEHLDQIQQRLYGDEDIDRILKKPQDNMTDRVSALIQTEKESLQKACSGFHGKLCYFWSLVTPRNESAPFDAAYTYRDLPFMERMTLAMTETMPDTGPVGTTEGLLNHTEEPARCGDRS